MEKSKIKKLYVKILFFFSRFTLYPVSNVFRIYVFIDKVELPVSMVNRTRLIAIFLYTIGIMMEIVENR